MKTNLFKSVFFAILLSLLLTSCGVPTTQYSAEPSSTSDTTSSALDSSSEESSSISSESATESSSAESAAESSTEVDAVSSADASTSNTADDVTVAPVEAKESDSLSFTMDDTAIELPVAYSTLSEMGWTMSDEDAAKDLDAATYQLETVDLTNEAYPDVTIKASFLNPSNETRILSDCSVYAVCVSNSTYDKNYDSYPAIATGAGIQFGSTADDLSNAYGEPMKTTEGSFDTSYVYQSGTTAMEFGVNNDLGVVRIQLIYLPARDIFA